MCRTARSGSRGWRWAGSATRRAGDGRTATDGSWSGTSKNESAPDVVAAQNPAPAQDTLLSRPPSVPGGWGTAWVTKCPSWPRQANAVPVPSSSPFWSVASLAPTSVQPAARQEIPVAKSDATSLAGTVILNPPVGPRDAVAQVTSSPWLM